VSSPSIEACPRLDGLPARELAGGLRVAEATTRRSRMKGLAKLDRLPPTLALHIPRCRSVHTFTMRFPLDLIWLDKAGHVVRIDPSVPPRRLKTCLRARSVIEARGGTADRFVAAGLVAGT
jgi:hypothetical protein